LTLTGRIGKEEEDGGTAGTIALPLFTKTGHEEDQVQEPDPKKIQLFLEQGEVDPLRT